MKSVSKYYYVIASGLFLVWSQYTEVSYQNVAMFLFLVGFSIYKEYLRSKGRIHDKDLILLEQKEQFESIKKELTEMRNKQEVNEKELVELRSKLSLATTRNTQVPSGVKW